MIYLHWLFCIKIKPKSSLRKKRWISKYLLTKASSSEANEMHMFCPQESKRQRAPGSVAPSVARKEQVSRDQLGGVRFHAPEVFGNRSVALLRFVRISKGFCQLLVFLHTWLWIHFSENIFRFTEFFIVSCNLFISHTVYHVLYFFFSTLKTFSV